MLHGEKEILSFPLLPQAFRIRPMTSAVVGKLGEKRTGCAASLFLSESVYYQYTLWTCAMGLGDIN